MWTRQTSVYEKATLKGWVRFWVVKRLPFLYWIPRYNIREDLLSDCIGGSTIGMVCLAQTLAHAAIATTSAIQGPYCAFMPALIYAFMGTSPHASVSSGAIAAIIIADQLTPWSDIEDRTQMATLLAFLSGITLVLVGAFKLSTAVRFLSQPTISGFITGGSLLIVCQQFKNLCSFPSLTECERLQRKELEYRETATPCHAFPHTDHFYNLCIALMEFFPESDLKSVVFGVILMIFLDGSNRLKAYAKNIATKDGPTWPHVVKRLADMKEIICVALATWYGYLTRNAHGHPTILTIGEIPAGLPPFKAPWDNPAFYGLMRNLAPKGRAIDAFNDPTQWVEVPSMLHHFIIGAVLVAFTTFLTTFATAKKMALKNSYILDPAQEMIGLGSAGIGGSFFGAFPPSGSLSRTGLADDCGVKTQFGGVFCAGIVGLGLVYLAPMLEYLPKTTLAAIIITSTRSLIDFSTPRKLLKFWRPKSEGGLRRDFIVWCTAFSFTLILGVLQGIGIAVMLSICILIYDSTSPDAVVLGKVQNTDVLGRKWRNVKDWPDAIRYDRIFIFEFRGPLSFASAEWFEERLEKKRKEEEIISGKKTQFVIISLQSVHTLDSTALSILEELLQTWKKNGIECIIAEARAAVRRLIEEELATRAKLLDQTAFMITTGDAVELARRRLEITGSDRNRRQEEKALLLRKHNRTDDINRW